MESRQSALALIQAARSHTNDRNIASTGKKKSTEETPHQIANSATRLTIVYRIEPEERGEEPDVSKRQLVTAQETAAPKQERAQGLRR